MECYNMNAHSVERRKKGIGKERKNFESIFVRREEFYLDGL